MGKERSKVPPPAALAPMSMATTVTAREPRTIAASTRLNSSRRYAAPKPYSLRAISSVKKARKHRST